MAKTNETNRTKLLQDIDNVLRGAFGVDGAGGGSADPGVTPTPVPAPDPPAGPTVTPQGTTGAQTWKYALVGINADGSKSSIGADGTTSTGNATLTGPNYNAVATPATAGIVTFDVYRTLATGSPSTTGKIGNVVAGGTLNDTGLVASGSSPTTPTLGPDVIPQTFVPPVAMTDVSTLVIAENSTARFVSVGNSISGQPVTVSYSPYSIYDQGIFTILPGGLWESPRPVTSAVYGICDSGQNSSVNPTAE